MAALGSEVGRESPDIRAAFSDGARQAAPKPGSRSLTLK